MGGQRALIGIQQISADYHAAFLIWTAHPFDPHHFPYFCLIPFLDVRREMIKNTHDELGRLDILVNNVGIQYVSPVHTFPEDKWDAIIAVCLSSAFHSTKAALPFMLEQGWGRIINTGSMHALVASPYKSAYNAAKHGIAGAFWTIEHSREFCCCLQMAAYLQSTLPVSSILAGPCQPRDVIRERTWPVCMLLLCEMSLHVHKVCAPGLQDSQRQ